MTTQPTPTPSEQDKIKLLYDAVSKDYDIGSEQEFRTKLQNPAKQRAFYDGVGAEYQLGTFDEFRQKIGAHQPKTQQAAMSAIPGVPQADYDRYQQAQQSPVLANPKVSTTHTKPASHAREKGQSPQLPEHGIVVDKRSGNGYIISNGQVEKFNAITGKNVNGEQNDRPENPLQSLPDNERATPVGYYTLDHDLSAFNQLRYGGLGMNMTPVAAHGQPAPKALDLQIHQTMNTAKRDPLYGSKTPWASNGCINCKKEDIEKLKAKFKNGDTLLVADSQHPQYRDLIHQLDQRVKQTNAADGKSPSIIPGMTQQQFAAHAQSPLLSNPKVRESRAGEYEQDLPEMRKAPKNFGGAVLNDIITNPYFQKTTSNVYNAAAGVERLAADAGGMITRAIGDGTKEVNEFKGDTDKAQFNLSTNVWNDKETANRVYDYLKGKGINPNDAEQVADYLSKSHSPNDRRALDYFGGPEWLEKRKDSNFDFEQVKKGQNLKSNAGKAFLNMMTLLPQSINPGSFFFDGYNRVSSDLDANQAAKNLTDDQKHLLGLMGGGVNYLAGKIKLPFGKGVTEKVLPYLTREAVQNFVEAGGKELTHEALAKAAQSTVQKFARRAGQVGIRAAHDLLHNTAVAGAMTTGNMGEQLLANQMAGQQIYDVSPENYGKSLAAAAGEFGAATLVGSLVRAPFEMLPKAQRNYISQKVAEAHSDDQIEALKNQVMVEGRDMGFNADQLKNAADAVDAYAELKRKVPQHLGAQRTNEILGLMAQRKQLNTDLSRMTANKEGTDDLFKSDYDTQISATKTNLESLEDKIKSIANGTTHQFIERDGHYYKVTDGNELLITKERYELEKVMEDADKTTQQKAAEQGVSHLDALIRNADTGTPQGNTSTTPAAEAGNSTNATTQPGESAPAVNTQVPVAATHKVADADALIRKAMSASAGETIEANGQVYQVVQNERSSNRQSGTAKIVRLIDGKPDHENGTIEINQKSDARNADRIHDQQQGITSATRLPDGRYSFGRGIRASGNVESLLGSVAAAEQPDQQNIETQRLIQESNAQLQEFEKLKSETRNQATKDFADVQIAGIKKNIESLTDSALQTRKEGKAALAQPADIAEAPVRQSAAEPKQQKTNLGDYELKKKIISEVPYSRALDTTGSTGEMMKQLEGLIGQIKNSPYGVNEASLREKQGAYDAAKAIIDNNEFRGYETTDTAPVAEPASVPELEVPPSEPSTSAAQGKTPEPAPATTYPAGSWSEQLSNISDSRSGDSELSSKIKIEQEVLKKLKDRKLINLKADKIIGRIKELISNNLVDREAAEAHIDSIDQLRNDKLDILDDRKAGSKEKGSTKERRSAGQEMTEEEESADISHEMDDAASYEEGSPMEVLDRALNWVEATIGEEKGKRGKRNTNTFSTVIPPAIGREIGIGALKAMRAALLATKSFTKAFQAAIKFGKENGLDGKALKEMRTWLHGTFAGLKAEHIADFVKENKVDRKNADKLKKAMYVARAKAREQLKDGAKAKDWHNAKSLVGDVLKDLKSFYKGKDLPFSKADIAKMTRVSMEATTASEAIKIINSLETIFGNAERSKLVSETEQLSAKVKKQLSSPKTSQIEREVFRRLQSIQSSQLTKPDGTLDYPAIGRLNKALSAIIDSHKDVKVVKDDNGGYALENEHVANHAVLNEVADDLEQLQNAHRERSAEAEAEELLSGLEAEGKIDTSSLTKAERDQLKQAIKDGTLDEINQQEASDRLAKAAESLKRNEKKSELLKDRVNGLAEAAMQRPELHESAPDPSGIRAQLRSLLKGGLNAGELSNAKLINLHRALSRMAENGDLSNIKDVLVHAHTETSLPEIKTLMGGKGAYLNALFGAMHKPHLFSKILPNDRQLAKWKVATGIQAWDKGYTDTRQTFLKTSEKALELIGQAGGVSSDSLKSGYGSLRRGVIAYLIQHYGGTPEDINQHFNEVSRANLDHTIEYLRQSPKDAAAKKQAELLTKIKSELLDGVSDWKGFMDKMEAELPAELKVIQHWMDSYAGHKEALADVQLLIKGSRMDGAIENYTSTKVVDSRNSEAATNQTLAEADNKLSMMSKKEAGSALRRERTPLRSGYLDFDFDKVQPQRFKEQLLEINTLPVRYQMDALFNDPRFEQTVFPGSKASMKRFYNAMLDTEKSRRGVNQEESEMSRKASRALDGLQSLASLKALGSVMQMGKQVPSVLVNTAVYLGNDAPLLFRAFRDVYKAHDLLEHSASSMRDNSHVAFTSTMAADQNGTKLGPVSRWIVSHMNSHGIKVLNMPEDIRKQFMEAVMMPLGKSDQYIAKVSYLAYYMKYLKESGANLTNLDWSQEAKNPSPEAMAYAEQLVDRNQNISDKTLAAWWLHPSGLSGKIGAFIFSPFSSFNLNQKLRSVGDINKLIYGSDMETKLEGARDFGATVAESVVFNLMKVYAIKYVGQSMGQLVANTIVGGHNADDDAKERERILTDGKANMEKVLGNSAQDVLYSGLGTLPTDILSYGTNLALTRALGQEPYISPTTGRVQLRTRQTLQTSFGKGIPFTDTERLKTYLGGFAPVEEMLVNTGERLSDVYHGYKEVPNTFTGKSTLVPLTDYEKSLKKWLVVKDMLTMGVGLHDADLIDRPMEAEERKAEADLKLNFSDGFKRVQKAINYHGSKYELNKMGSNYMEVDAYRNRIEKTPLAQQLNSDYQFYRQNIRQIEPLRRIYSAIIGTGHITAEARELMESYGKRIIKAFNTGKAVELGREDIDRLVKVYAGILKRNRNIDAAESLQRSHEFINQILSDKSEDERNEATAGIDELLNRLHSEQIESGYND
ncbi:hypothetical protein GCM10027037_03330 [Mucilaginibacter koreensis]